MSFVVCLLVKRDQIIVTMTEARYRMNIESMPR